MNMFDLGIVQEYLKRGKKLLDVGNIEDMQRLYNESVSDIPIDYCENCKHDNMGSCYIEDSDKFKICFANWLNNLENLLSE